MLQLNLDTGPAHVTFQPLSFTHTGHAHEHIRALPMYMRDRYRNTGHADVPLPSGLALPLYMSSSSLPFMGRARMSDGFEYWWLCLDA